MGTKKPEGAAKPADRSSGLRTCPANGADTYNFEFLGLMGEDAERDLENALTSRITETLWELGLGFSFVRRQVTVTLRRR